MCRVAPDSIAALAAMAKLASPIPMTNGLGAELALRVEESELGDLRFGQIKGRLNSMADWG